MNLMRPPPRLLRLLARLLTTERNREFVLGDLDELYASRVARMGRLRAGLRYLWDVLSSAAHRPRNRASHRLPPPPLRRKGGTLREVEADVVQGIRVLRRRPAFTLLLVGTLAVGIGPSTTVLGMVDQLLRWPLQGAANSSAAAYLSLTDPEEDFGGAGLTLQEFDAMRARASLLSGSASYATTGQQVSVGDGRPIRVMANTVYGDFFEVLGVRPSEGRLIDAAETTLDANPLVVVISQDLRNRLFGLDETAVGRTLRMNGKPVEIVGVAGGGFRGAVRGQPRDAWLPHGALVPLLGFARERLESPRSAMHRQMLVLPRDGVSLEAVEEQVSEVLAGLSEADPSRGEVLARLRPIAAAGLQMPPEGRERTHRTLSLMAWAAGLLLAIACANAANLLLFQNLARRGSLATLRALGASTGRIVRQQLVGSLVLAAVGGAGGVVLGRLIAQLFRGELLLGMPAFEGVVLNRSLMLWVSGVTLTTVVLFGVVPAMLAGRFNLAGALGESRTHETGHIGRLRIALCAGQIAMTLGLLVGGLLMVRTLTKLNGVDTGVNIERVAGATVEVPEDLSPAELHGLQRSLVQAVAAEPGVAAAALDLYGPHGSQSLERVGLPAAGEVEPRSSMRTLVWQVSPGWFELFGLPAVNGRTLEDADWVVPSSGAAVLTASLAERLFGRTDVVGQGITVVGATPEERRVIGVVSDYTSLITVTATTPEEALRPSGPTDAVFLPFGDMRVFQMTVFAKLESASGDGPARIGRVVESIITDVPAPEPYWLSDRVDRIHLEERLLERLLLVLSLCGALLAGVGLFAVIYLMVGNRRREFGVRVALGADGARIVELVMRSAAKIVLAGVGAGLLVAYPLSRALQSRLFGVDPLDAVSYLAAVGSLVLVALLACVTPAKEALQADPVAVIRQE